MKMKIKLLIISCILLLTSLAFAQAWWSANANVFVSSLQVKGQVRRIQPISLGAQKSFVLAKNNDSAMVIRFNPAQPRLVAKSK